MVIVEFGTEGFVCGDLFLILEEDWRKTGRKNWRWFQ